LPAGDLCAEQDPEPALVAIRGVGPWEGRSPSREAEGEARSA